MKIRRFARKMFPPIARRDEKLADMRLRNRALRDEVARLKGPGKIEGPGKRPKGVDVEAAVDLIRRSGVFDEEWYLGQMPEDFDIHVDPVMHYVLTGSSQGLSPHPAFLHSWYLKRIRASKMFTGIEAISAAPLLHYLTAGKDANIPPHPMFDGEWFSKTYPESQSHPGGALGYFLAAEDRVPEIQAAQIQPTDHPLWSRTQFLSTARYAADSLRHTRGFAHLERDVPTFDFDAEANLKQKLRAEATLPAPAPMVSIIVPTKDRAGILGASIDSVLAQTYATWQLIIIDDGSRDNTAEMLAPYLDDPRILLLTHPESRGVASARNTGLEAATGRYIAYLDSDNTWRADFLELMARFMSHEGHRAAYAMSALIEDGGQERVVFRGMPFSREAMKERNYIDCIVLVHERSLLEEVGTFDVTLRRNVDWDLFIRLVDACPFGFLPVIATEYDVWEDRTARITTDEPTSYRYVVRQRALIDWTHERERQPERIADLLSVVIVATAGAGAALNAAHRALATARSRVEIILVDNGLSESESVRLLFELERMENANYYRLPQPLTIEVARNVGASRSRGVNLVFLPQSAWCETDWDRPLVQALRIHSAVQPLTLSNGGAVWSAGQSFLSNGRGALVYRGFAGDAPELRGIRQVDGASSMCLAVRAENFAAVEGFNPLYVGHHAGSELSLRLHSHTDLPAACVGFSHVSLRTAPADPTKAAALRVARENDLMLKQLWGTQASTFAAGLQEDGFALTGFNRQRNAQVEPIPVLVHDRPDRPLRWAIKIGAPSVEKRYNWGDWHFALALRNALERCGHEVTIDCYYEWYRPSAYLDDVVVVIRGVSRYETNPGHTNVCWVISHPDRVLAAEAQEYDLVFGASPRWCNSISPKLSHPAELLLQCTDQRRFHPVDPDLERVHSVLSVANARGIRPSVAASLEAGIVPAVYGVRWNGLLPEGAWRGDYVPNDELAAVYVAAGVVLNDHWEDMLSEGLVSNRLFDLAACNARVISDYMPEIEDIFGSVILTFRSAADLPDLVSTHLHESADRRADRELMGEHVRKVHTFDARAATLSERVVQLRALRAEATL